MKKAKLPNPPEGHYWRVERSSPDLQDRELRIFPMWRRPWYLGGDHTSRRPSAGPRTATASPTAPVRSCVTWETRRVIDGLLGDYPPKELP